MLRNYLLIHFRSLINKPLQASINIFGLSIGICACLLCYLHVQNELSYDTQVSSGKRIFRLVNGDMDTGDGWVKVSAPIPPLLTEQIPEITKYSRLARVTYNPKITVQYQENVFNESNFYMADPDFLDMFDFKIISGKRESAIHDINSVIISNGISKKLFNEEDPIGKTIELGGKHLFQITGVFEDIPSQAHISIDYLINFQNLERIFPGTSLTSNWGQFNYYAYVMLVNAIDEELTEEKIAATVVALDEDNEMLLEDLNLQPLLDIHFTANRGNAKPAYDRKYLFIYGAVAFATLLISIINFINLSIAGSTKRIREVGIRKVVGARRWQLVVQHISESIITSSLAMTFALLLSYYFLLPAMNTVLQSDITLQLANPILLLILGLMVLFISILAGFYIAIFVTGFSPSKALRGTLMIGSGGSAFKSILLGAQFTISLVLILSSLIIYQQLRYLHVKDIGLDPEQIINISLYNEASRDNVELLKQEMGRHPWVISSTATRFTAGKANWHQTSWWEGQEEDESMSVILADEDFIKTLDLTIIEGSQKLVETKPQNGEVRYILNEAARKHIGWQTALGKSFHIFGEKSKAPISAVVKDFNYQSLHKEIDPVVIAVYKNIKPGQLMVKVSTDDYSVALKELGEIFVNVVPNTPFEYYFLDDQFAELYRSENRTAKVVGFMTVIAMLLALLGLYGLVSFTVSERTKELSIRKVLGVKLSSVLALLSTGYLKLLLLANLIAVPVVWYGMRNWLTNFSFHINLSPIIFIAGSALVWLFVLITVSFNVYQVTKIDLIKGLRYE